MGILKASGVANPFTDWLDQHRNAVTQFGSGLASGRGLSEGIARGTQGLASGAQQDTAYATQQKADADRQAQLDKAVERLQEKYPDLAGALQSGVPMGDVFQEVWRRQSPDYQPKPLSPISVSPGETILDPTTHQPIFTGPMAPKEPSIPAGYRPSQDGNGLTYIPGGPADPSTTAKTTEATRRNQQLASVIEPELNSLLGNGTAANPGTFDALSNGYDIAKAAAGPAAQALGQGPSAEYQQASNSLKTIIASYLYSVSGATANPGEVETQASVLTPKLNESKGSVAAKKARIKQMVEAVKAAATGTPISVGSAPAPGSTLTYNPATGDLE